MSLDPIVRPRSPARLSGSAALAALMLTGAAFAFPSMVAAEPRHGVSIFGDLKYGPDFEHFDYADPAALKGGSMTLALLGTYDSTQSFLLKGKPAFGTTNVYDTLMSSSLDESSASYALLAESIDVAEDGGSVTFGLRPEAMFHDGHPVDAEDVVWSFETLMSEGHPQYRNYWTAVSGAEAIDDRTVRFTFSETDNPELPVIIGQLPVLPKHFWADRTFGETTLDPLLGSGPYRFGTIDPGRSITYERVEDYWGRDLPVNVGRNNFDLRYDYYRDTTVGLEALKAGDSDFRLENTAKNWATAYDFPALTDGRVVREELPDESTQLTQAFLFNLRQDKYDDPRVRRALAYTFDFEWMNANLFYGAYERTMSYFQNSDMQATGVPEGRELEILEPFRDQLPAALFEEPYSLPVMDGSGNIRRELRQAIGLFKEAGWEVQDGAMTHLDSGEAFTLDVIIRQPNVEKVVLAWKKNLERLGIELNLRVVDTAQYQKRMVDFDYDVTTHLWLQTDSPGNEQYDYWHSRNVDVPGSRNVAGIDDPVIDAIIPIIVRADSRQEQVAATKALDRVLLWRDYALLQYFGPTNRIAYTNKFSRPEILPRNALGLEYWWVDPVKEAALSD